MFTLSDAGIYLATTQQKQKYDYFLHVSVKRERIKDVVYPGHKT